MLGMKVLPVFQSYVRRRKKMKEVKVIGIVMCCGMLLMSGCTSQESARSPDGSIAVVSRYTFDTGDGTADSGPDGYTGTLVGSPELTEGKSGNGLKLDGRSGMVIPSGAVKVGRSFTAAAWFKIDPESPSVERPSIGPYRILSVGCLGENTSGFLLSLDTSYGRGAIVYCVGNRNGSPYWDRVSELSINTRDGQWHHIAVVFDLNNRFAVGYIDGEMIDEVPLPRVTAPSPMADIDNCIGGYYRDGQVGEGVSGVIDDVVVINNYLEGEDILKIMDGSIF
jgi:hypothetical protein